MVKPSVKREVVNYAKDKYQIGLGLLCQLVGWSRSTWYYESKIDDSELITELKRLSKSHPNRGFDNYYDRLRREGYTWARSRVLRVYRELGLVRRPKKRKRLPEALRQPLYQPQELNEIWSMDFMSDNLSDGRTFRVLNVIDDCNRECLMCQGSISYPSKRVTRCLDELIEYYGKPKYIRTDNGPEFISKEYKLWCQTNGIIPVNSQPGRPMENGYIERFNKTYREDILDAYLFSTITQHNILAEKWRDDYNRTHPHKSLGKLSPMEYKSRKPFHLNVSVRASELPTLQHLSKSLDGDFEALKVDNSNVIF